MLLALGDKESELLSVFTLNMFCSGLASKELPAVLSPSARSEQGPGALQDLKRAAEDMPSTECFEMNGVIFAKFQSPFLQGPLRTTEAILSGIWSPSRACPLGWDEPGYNEASLLVKDCMGNAIPLLDGCEDIFPDISHQLEMSGSSDCFRYAISSSAPEARLHQCYEVIF